MVLRFDKGCSPALIARAHAIRRAVFIDEQQISDEEEWDGLDPKAVHFIAVSHQQDVATGRLMIVDRIAKFQRIAVIKHARGQQYGVAVMHEMMNEARENAMVTKFQLSAQIQALGFYEKLGFRAEGPTYDDAGIPHRTMSAIL